MTITRRRLAVDLAQELRDLVASKYEPGAQLPSEKVLADEFRVSRNTVREALIALWDEGLVVRRWGVGTFVSDRSQPMSQSISPVIPTHDLVQGRQIELLSASVGKAGCPPEAAGALDLEPGAEVWHIERTFARDGKPAFILMDWLPLTVNGVDIDPGAVQNAGTGLLDILRDTARCTVTRMEAEFRASTADATAAGQLSAAPGTPIIVAEQVSLDGRGDPVIFSRNLYHTGVSTLHMVRTPQGRKQ